jgi:hypothetical protein
MDTEHIQKLLEIAASPEGLHRAQKIANDALVAANLPPFPKNACAATLSSLLQLAGINVPMTLGAGKLAHILHGPIHSRNWIAIPVGSQQAGDVGVTFDDNNIPGADHVYLVVKVVTTDEMIIADNQATELHKRAASGAGGRTPTEYFVRAAPSTPTAIHTNSQLPRL